MKSRFPIVLPFVATALCSALVVLGVACRQQTSVDPSAAVETATPVANNGPPLFEDITNSCGLSFTYRNGEEANHLSILESLGGGVGLIDFDGDGLLDVFLPGGGGYGPNKEIVGLPCKLFKNLGNGKFQDVTEKAGLTSLAGGQPWFYSHGVAVGDYDRDGWPDLLVTGWRRVALFHNVPVDANDPSKGRRFVDATAEAGLDSGITWATSAAFGDLDGDGYPDLYICQYVDWSFANHPPCNYNSTISDVCPPKVFNGLTHKVYRNDGKGKFVDVSAEAGLVPGGKEASKGLGVVMVAIDGAGKPDIYVANDTTPKFLYRNMSTPGAIKLKEVGLRSGAAFDEQGKPNGSMGMDAGDYDGSGRPSLFVTNYEQEQHGLYHNSKRAGDPNTKQPADPFFEHQTIRSGIAEMGQKNVGWGTAFIDVDLDGWEDLFLVNGHAIRFPQGSTITRKQPPVLFHNIHGRFKNISDRIGAYGKENHLARGVGFGDLDNDGRTDLVISHINDPVAILRGIGGAGCHWIGVTLLGKDRADIVGARAELPVAGRTLTRFAKSGGSYLSSGDRRLIFGLGEATTTGPLTVTWPDGSKQQVEGLAIDRYNEVRQK